MHIVTRRVAVILHAWVAAHLNTVVSPYKVDAPLVDDLILEENKTRKWRIFNIDQSLTYIYSLSHTHTHTHTHTHVHTHIYTQYNAHQQIHIYVCTLTNIHSCWQAHIHKH